ncbi:hypothetical protein [Prochlorococcus sp. MIT 1307]|uniref:hypothetical protein n=1 Tax=Prochlorococcus sp. MIT 1307 TaxID=3096219 RepID=UPI002A761241|nr:hypothetical protein [Prochlorococcus sp. MIT 1307]
MPTLQLCRRQALSYSSHLPSQPTTHPIWRASDFTVSSLDAATRERDWLVSRGGLTL